MLELKDRDFLFKGGKRACYEHPSDPDLLIKVLLPKADPALVRRKHKKLRRRLLPASYHDENRREVAAYRRIEKRIGEKAWAHIPRFHGTIPTDLGSGVVVRFIRHADGRPADNLRAALSRVWSPAVDQAVDRMLAFVEEHHLVPRDFGPHNTSVATGIDGTVTAYIIDGFGSAEFFPISERIPSIGARNAKRCTDRYRSRLERWLAVTPPPPPPP